MENSPEVSEDSGNRCGRRRRYAPKLLAHVTPPVIKNSVEEKKNKRGREREKRKREISKSYTL